VCFPDAIGCQPAVASFERTGEFLYPHTFDIPYGILLPRGIDNLVVGSGKSVSCQPQGIIRGMSGCMIVGQGAGAAAALAAQGEMPPRLLPAESLQSALLAQGVYLAEGPGRA
jgi:hypothetical protein